MEIKKFMGLDFSSEKCAWALVERRTDEELMTREYVLSSFSSFSFDDYDKKTHGTNINGYKVMHTNLMLLGLLNNIIPDFIFFEEIFAQTVTGYKTLSKIQGAAELACFQHNIHLPIIYSYAKEVRAHYGLNVHKKTYMKGLNADLICEKHYQLQLKTLEARSSKVDDAKKIKLHQKIFSKPATYLAKEYDVYKKQVVVDFVNAKFGLTLSYADNDLADAILNGYHLARVTDFVEEPKKSRKKK